MNCPETKKSMADWLFEPLPEEARKHIAGCAGCAEELASMQNTWKLLDEWEAPEPSAFFDARLYARLRTEQEREPANLFERAKAWLLYRSNLHFRPLPLAAGAMATLLVVGGGTFALLNQPDAPVVQSSAIVRDLQSYDGNAQLFQQLNALDGDEEGATGGSN